MLRFLVPLVLTMAATARAIQFQPLPQYSAASEAQIRLALENKYDDTGPGAKRPEFAYNTYKTLEEALIAYIDDPDTKLPEADREKAIQKLTLPNGEYNSEDNQELKRYYPKTVEEYTRGNSNRPKVQEFVRQKIKFAPILTKLNAPKKISKPFFHLSGYLNQFNGVRDVQRESEDLFNSQKNHLKLLRVVPYSRDPDLQLAHDQFDAHPKYSYSYGVHVPDTGDTKTAHETRNGGSVQGFYSFMDPDGQQRTVHYTADDLLGFRAVVNREALS